MAVVRNTWHSKCESRSTRTAVTPDQAATEGNGDNEDSSESIPQIEVEYVTKFAQAII